MRTSVEILARIAATRDDDFLGFRAQVLISALDFEHAQPLLKEGTTSEEWNPTIGVPATLVEALGYLEFAFGKAKDHRGISANRSVDKLTEYAWLLGRDSVVAEMGETDFAQYGVPILFVFAQAFGVDLPEDEDLQRMSQGLPCRDGCMEGCGV